MRELLFEGAVYCAFPLPYQYGQFVSPALPGTYQR